MKIIKLEQAEKHENSEKCKVLEYGFNDKDIDCTTATIKGRYPDTGYCMNEECKELIIDRKIENVNFSLNKRKQK